MHNKGQKNYFLLDDIKDSLPPEYTKKRPDEVAKKLPDSITDNMPRGVDIALPAKCFRNVSHSPKKRIGRELMVKMKTKKTANDTHSEQVRRRRVELSETKRKYILNKIDQPYENMKGVAARRTYTKKMKADSVSSRADSERANSTENNGFTENQLNRVRMFQNFKHAGIPLVLSKPD